jgi:hypothetical protein
MCDGSGSVSGDKFKVYDLFIIRRLMPHLRSLEGFWMTTKYVKNWYSALAVYTNVKPKTTVKFKDGMNIDLSKDDYLIFYNELYKRHLLDNGFTYKTEGNKVTVRTPDGLQMTLLNAGFFAVDEIFFMRVYGEPSLKGRAVVDIGASIGDTPLFFVSRGASKVYGFEPNIERYELALQNINLNNMTDKIQIFNTQATSKLLENLIFQFSLRNVFLKIDCEGCEYDMIGHTDDVVFQNIDDVVLEYHKNPKPILERLAKLGFRVRQRKEIIFATRG